jgi:hypothetical protein
VAEAVPLLLLLLLLLPLTLPCLFPTAVTTADGGPLTEAIGLLDGGGALLLLLQ